MPQLRLLDSMLDVAPLVVVTDAHGNAIPEAPLTLSVPAPLHVTAENLITADREAIATVTITSGPASASLEAHFIVDLTRIRWRITYRCYDGFRVVGPEAAAVDSTRTEVVSDSVKHENLDPRGPTTRIYLWSTGTTTVFYSDGQVISAPAEADPRRPLVFIRSVGKVLYYPREGGSVPMSEGNSDGGLPPTYTGGNLCPGAYNGFSPVVLE